MSKVADYYDDYTVRQQKIGINNRHLSIQNWLEKFGLKKTDDVLEIGCGIGTQTKLLAEYLNPTSRIVANDISPKSIEIGKTSLSNHKNIEWIAADVIQYNLQGKFDVVVLPDVIEHIPIEQHFELFKKIRSVLKPTGFVLIHIPNPYFLQWCHQTRPETLQVIDQPIYTNLLTANTYPNGFYIHFLETYSIWKENCDYQAIVLKCVRADLTYHEKPYSFTEKVGRKVKQLFKKVSG